MGNKIGGKKKSEIVVENTIRILDALVAQCQKGRGISNKFKAVIIGYGTKAHICYDKDAPAIQEDLDNGRTILDVVENGLTNMEEAFVEAKRVIGNWMARQRESNKPMPAPRVVNITDGHPEIQNITDEDAMRRTFVAAQNVTSMDTEDGPVLLSNIFIHDASFQFPNSETEATNSIKEDWAKRNAKFLFSISSKITESLCTQADSRGLKAQLGSRLLQCSNKPEDILKFMDFASRPNGTNNNTPVYPTDFL